MARNQEKALTLFSRWETFKTDYHSKDANRRPLGDHEVNSLPEAESRRRDIIREVTKKISIIQNATLGEPKLREINDEINKLMKKKHFLETKIRELGGVVNRQKQYYDIEGVEIPGVRGYKYYGAAKQLPGVREQLAVAEEEKEDSRRRRTRADIYKGITPDYYGFRDEDDGVLAEKEALREAELMQEDSESYAEEMQQALAAATSSSTTTQQRSGMQTGDDRGASSSSFSFSPRERGLYEEFMRSNNELYSGDDEDVYLQLLARGLLNNSQPSSSQLAATTTSVGGGGNLNPDANIQDFLLEQKRKALLQLI